MTYMILYQDNSDNCNMGSTLVLTALKTSLYLTRDINGQPKPNLGQKKVARPSPISVNEEFRLSHLYLSWSIEL